MGMPLAKRAAALAGLVSALSMAGVAAAQDASDAITRLNQMGFPFDENGEVKQAVSISFSNGFLVSMFGDGKFLITSNEKDILSGALVTSLGSEKELRISLVTERGSIDLALYPREGTEKEVIFDGALTIGGVTSPVTPGLISGVGDVVDVSECGCVVLLPPIEPNGAPRTFIGPGCTKRDCNLNNPCTVSIPSQPAPAPANPRKPSEAITLLAAPDVIVVEGQALDAPEQASETIAEGDQIAEVVEESQAQPAAAATTYNGSCDSTGSEHLAFGFLGVAALTAGLLRRRVLA
jgi:hypothetical protein